MWLPHSITVVYYTSHTIECNVIGVRASFLSECLTSVLWYRIELAIYSLRMRRARLANVHARALK